MTVDLTVGISVGVPARRCLLKIRRGEVSDKNCASSFFDIVLGQLCERQSPSVCILDVVSRRGS
jgi:hypothetical protein